MVVSLLARSLAGVVAVGIVVGGQIATVIAIQMIVMMGVVMGTEIILVPGTAVIVVAVSDMLMIVTDLPGIGFRVIGMEVDLIVTRRMDT